MRAAAPAKRVRATLSLPNEVSLPKDFPKDRVPLPDNIRITSASSISSNGQTLNTLEFYSKDDASKISDYFTGELPKHDWTQALATTSNGESLLSYSAGQDQAENVTVTITKADVSGYQKVDMLRDREGSRRSARSRTTGRGRSQCGRPPSIGA